MSNVEHYRMNELREPVRILIQENCHLSVRKIARLLGKLNRYRLKKIAKLKIRDDIRLKIFNEIVHYCNLLYICFSFKIESSKSTVHRILRSLQLHPYRVEEHQKLFARDFENRTLFCIRALQKLQENSDFFDEYYLRTKRHLQIQAG